MADATLVRTLLWQELEQPGSHWFQLWRAGSGWQFRGVAVRSDGGMPTLARYQIDLDEQWQTRAAQVTVQRGNGSVRTLHVEVDATQGWHFRREPASEPGDAPVDLVALDGLIDIDLSLTPGTNTLPIRRLGLAIGESAEVTAVWIDADLAVHLLPQRYLRLDEQRYRYESSDGAFVAELEVDELGLVTSYEGLWRRIAQTGPAK